MQTYIRLQMYLCYSPWYSIPGILSREKRVLSLASLVLLFPSSISFFLPLSDQFLYHMFVETCMFSLRTLKDLAMWKGKKSFLICSFISQFIKNIACQKKLTYINLAAEHLQKPSKVTLFQQTLSSYAYISFCALNFPLSSSISCLFCSHLLSTYDRNDHI